MLCTDDSGIGLDAVLMQHDKTNKLRKILYASRVLNKAKRNYNTTHQEVIWALRHFHDLVFGFGIHVLTDHGPVTEHFEGKTCQGNLSNNT